VQPGRKQKLNQRCRTYGDERLHWLVAIGRCCGGAALHLILALVVAGCAAPIAVRRASPEAVHRALTGSVLSTGKPSEFSLIALRQHDLIEGFDNNPEVALAALRDQVIREAGDTQGLFALAELSFFHAEHSKKKPYFLAAAIYAYAYLFPSEKAQQPDPLDSRFRLACDLYNRALTEALKSENGERVQLVAGSYELPFGTLSVAFDESQLLLGNRRLVDFVPTGEFEVTGLRNLYRQPGLGAPLAAKTEPAGPNDPAASLVGPNVRVAATALLRLDWPRQQVAGDELRGRLELHAGSEEERIELDGKSVPLELEPSVALALALTEVRPWEAELGSFLGSLVNVHRPVLQLFARGPYRGPNPRGVCARHGL